MAAGNETASLVQRQDYPFDMAFCGDAQNCLGDTLLFALRKFKQQPEPIRSEVSAAIPIVAQVFDAGGTQLK